MPQLYVNIHLLSQFSTTLFTLYTLFKVRYSFSYGNLSAVWGTTTKNNSCCIPPHGKLFHTVYPQQENNSRLYPAIWKIIPHCSHNRKKIPGCILQPVKLFHTVYPQQENKSRLYPATGSKLIGIRLLSQQIK